MMVKRTQFTHRINKHEIVMFECLILKIKVSHKVGTNPIGALIPFIQQVYLVNKCQPMQRLNATFSADYLQLNSACSPTKVTDEPKFE